MGLAALDVMEQWCPLGMGFSVGMKCASNLLRTVTGEAWDRIRPLPPELLSSVMTVLKLCDQLWEREALWRTRAWSSSRAWGNRSEGVWGGSHSWQSQFQRLCSLISKSSRVPPPDPAEAGLAHYSLPVPNCHGVGARVQLWGGASQPPQRQRELRNAWDSASPPPSPASLRYPWS